MLAERLVERKGARMEALAGRLAPSLARVLGDAERDVRKGRERQGVLAERLETAPAARFAQVRQRLEALDRTRMTLGYAETLKRGFAVVRGDGAVVTTKASAERATALEIEFADGRVAVGGRAKARKAGEGPEQGSLF